MNKEFSKQIFEHTRCKRVREGGAYKFYENIYKMTKLSKASEEVVKHVSDGISIGTTVPELKEKIENKK